MKRKFAAIAAFAMLAAATAAGQTKKLAQGPNRIELTLERQEHGNWRAVDPGLVFDTGDRVRFRFPRQLRWLPLRDESSHLGQLRDAVPARGYRGAEPHRGGEGVRGSGHAGLVSDHRAAGLRRPLLAGDTPLAGRAAQVSAPATAAQERPGSAPPDAALRRHHFQSSRRVRGQLGGAEGR